MESNSFHFCLFCSLVLQHEALRWEGNVDLPKSICSEPCPIGHVHNHQDQCCWSCVKCREDAFVKNDTCISCQPGWAPNERKNGCDKLRPEVIDWWSPWAYVPLCFASIGILATTFTICVFIKYVSFRIHFIGPFIHKIKLIAS